MVVRILLLIVDVMILINDDDDNDNDDIADLLPTARKEWRNMSDRIQTRWQTRWPQQQYRNMSMSSRHESRHRQHKDFSKFNLNFAKMPDYCAFCRCSFGAKPYSMTLFVANWMKSRSCHVRQCPMCTWSHETLMLNLCISLYPKNLVSSYLSNMVPLEALGANLSMTLL